MGDSISAQLQLVDMKNNQISKVTFDSAYNNTLMWENLKTLVFYNVTTYVPFGSQVWI